jgi:hypothetical protein
MAATLFYKLLLFIMMEFTLVDRLLVHAYNKFPAVYAYRRKHFYVFGKGKNIHPLPSLEIITTRDSL